MFYRTYRYGIRLTCEAQSARQARQRFAKIAQDFIGQRNGPRMIARPDLNSQIFFSARSLNALNVMEGN